MVKKGKDRRKKFSIKHDPDTIMLRWKALRDFSIEKFFIKAIGSETIDDNIREYLDLYKLPYGKRGEFHDYFYKYLKRWNILTEKEKEAIKHEWEIRGFPLELFEKITEKLEELKRYYISPEKSPVKADLILKWIVELQPYPPEAEEDFTIRNETIFETETAKHFPWWRQEGFSHSNLQHSIGNPRKRNALITPAIELDFKVEIMTPPPFPILEIQNPTYNVPYTFSDHGFTIEAPELTYQVSVQ